MLQINTRQKGLATSSPTKSRQFPFLGLGRAMADDILINTNTFILLKNPIYVQFTSLNDLDIS